MFFKKKKIETRQAFYPVNFEQDFFTAQIDNIVLSALQFYTNPIKELPLYVMDGEGLKLKDHALSFLLNNPSSKNNRAVFYSRALQNLLLYGEAFIEIIGRTFPTELFLYWERYDAYQYEINSRTPFSKEYFRTHDGRVLLSEDMIYLRETLGTNTTGKSRLKTIQSISSILGKTTYNVLNQGFSARGLLSGVNDNSDSEKAKEFQRKLGDFFRSSDGFKVLSMLNGQDLKSFIPDFKPENFVLLKKLLNREIYSLFSIPQALASDYSGSVSYKALTESLAVFVRTSLSPTLAILENELSYKLLNTEEKSAGYKIQFEFENLLRGDFESLYKNLSLASGQQAFLTPNEIRKKIGLAPLIEGGDELPKKDETKSEVNND